MKKTFILTTVLALSQLLSYGQNIPNGEFENWTNPITIPGWGFAGNSGQSTEVEVNTQNGKEFLKPFSGDYFCYLQNTNAALGQAQSYFAMTDRPSTLEAAFAAYPSGDDLYAIYLTFGKWNTTTKKRDTILNMIILGPLGATHPWSYRQFDLTNSYLSDETPDSCFINIFAGVKLNNGNLSAGEFGSSVCVDNIKFTNYKVSTSSVSKANLSVTSYPNPASNKTTLSYNVPTYSQVDVTVTDMTGKIVYTVYSGMQSQGKQEVAIDVSTLKPGIYFIQVKVGNAVETKKLIVTK